MDLIKSIDFFDPADCKHRIHIIGCGAVGSTIAENLIRLGLTKITLYDFDIVEPHNIANQMFTSEDVGRLKAEALKDLLVKINPAAEQDIHIDCEGYTNQPISGYVFLAVDSIELRRKIVEQLQYNSYVEAVFDVRLRLTDAQSFAADWSSIQQKQYLLQSMQFSDAEAIADTPVSACQIQLSVAPTIRIICAYCITNFMNFIHKKDLKSTIIVDAFSFTLF